MLDRINPPVSKPVSKIDFTKAKTITIDNGIPLHVVRAGNHEIIRLEIIFKSGNWFENDMGTAFFCTKLMLEGTDKMNSREISEFFDQYGAYFQAQPGMDYVNFTLYTLNRHLNTLLPIVYEIISQASFPDEELETLKNIRIQQLKVEEEKNSYLASRDFKKLLFGDNHPYGTELSIDSIEKIDRGMLTGFYHDILISDPEIIISGNVSDQHINQVISTFSEMKVSKIPEKKFDRKSSKSTHLDTPKDDSVQVSLRYGNLIINKGHRDFIDLLILNEILGGYFGSRLMKSIREDKGYTYGIYSSVVSMIHDAYFVIASDVKKEHAEDAMMGIKNEIRQLQEYPVGKEELITVKNYMTGSFLSSLETSFALADKFKSVYFYGLDYSYYDNLLDRMANISTKRIQDLAIQYLKHEDFNLVTVG